MPTSRSLWPATGRRTLSFAALSLLSAVALAAPSTQLSIRGQVNTPTTYDLAGLVALPAITQTVAFYSGSTPQTHEYTGASLWGMLGSTGIKTDPNVRNDILNKYAVATGSDGYRAVFALGELHTNFGNRPSLVAYGETIGGSFQYLGDDGFARTTSPGDVRGGRYVSNLTSIDVFGSASTATGIGGGLSTQFSISGDVLRPGVFDLAALQSLPEQSVVTGADTYTGVSFWDLLNSTAGLATDPNVHNDVLGMYVVATGSDGYKAVFSLGELNPNFGNQPNMIAYAINGGPLDTSGFARVLAPYDVARGRWVSNLVSLEVFHAAVVPEPSTYALLLAGLAGVAVAARRRARTPASTH